MIEEELEQLDQLSDTIADVGRELMTQCQGSIFPCDALAVTILARSLNIVKGFGLLINDDNYQCAAGLLRFQLDNVLRFWGVTTCSDPHGIASELLNGIPLFKIKHDTGPLMRDAFLVELLGKKNPWVPDTYKMLSGFIHLSDHHFQHMLMQSTLLLDGTREFRVSDTDDYVPAEQKVNLIRTFLSVTRGTSNLVQQWSSNRNAFGSTEHLKARFNKIA